MSLGSTFENDVLKLILNATAIGNLADNAATAPLTNMQLSLHTADPLAAGSQTTSEATYTGYARVAVARTAGGWTVTGNSASPVAAIGFPACTAGANTLSHFMIGTASSGAGKQLARGILGSALGPMTGAVTDTITIPGLTGIAIDDRIAFEASIGSTLPTGITEGVLYWVKTVSGDSVTISTTQGGATLDITASGDGFAYRMTPLVVSSGVTPSITTGMTITLL
jgi:hypothetical protein